MSFSLDVSEFAKVVQKRADHVRRVVAVDVFSKVITRTPVDTGRLRGNWNISSGSPDYSTSPKRDPSGAEAFAEIRTKVKNAQESESIWMANGLVYAPIVEYGLYPSRGGGETEKTINGYSKQAPKGMVRITVAEFDAAIRRAVKSAKAIE